MPDIFLYAGEATPTDVLLSDPTVLRGGAPATITVSATDSLLAGLSEATDLIGLLAPSDAPSVPLQDSAGAILVVFSAPDSAVVQASDDNTDLALILSGAESGPVQAADSLGDLAASLAPAESASVQSAESLGALSTFLAPAEILAAVATESVGSLSVSLSPVESVPAKGTDLGGDLLVSQAAGESEAVVVTDNNAVIALVLSGSETGAVAGIDSVGSLAASLSPADSLAIVMSDPVGSLSASLEATAEQIAIQDSDSLGALLADQAVSDAPAILTIESAILATSLEATDSVSPASTEDAALSITLDGTDLLAPGGLPGEEVDLSAALDAADSVRVVIGQEGLSDPIFVDAADSISASIAESSATSITHIKEPAISQMAGFIGVGAFARVYDRRPAAAPRRPPVWAAASEVMLGLRAAGRHAFHPAAEVFAHIGPVRLRLESSGSHVVIAAYFEPVPCGLSAGDLHESHARLDILSGHAVKMIDMGARLREDAELLEVLSYAD